MSLQVLRCVVITAEDVVGVAINLDIATNAQVGWSDPLAELVDILVLVASQEWTLNNARVLHSWLIDRNAIVGQVERDDETAVDVLWHLGVETSIESQDLLVVVHTLEEVTLWLLWHQVINVAKSINLISKSIVWGHLTLSWLWGSWASDSAQFKVTVIF